MSAPLPVARAKAVFPARFGERGQSLIEAILGLAILLILFHAFGSLIITAYDLLGNARTRITARHLAVLRMEEIRNLPYDSVGVVGGIPSGAIAQSETLNRNGLDFVIRSSVVFIDDAFDGLAPSDTSPADYKRARVDVSWTGRFVVEQSVTMITDIALEPATGGGLLSILVFNANAEPVPQAVVHIINASVNPIIDVTLLTDDQGRVSLPGAPACSNCYEITVSKEGMSTDRTYSTAEVANPSKPHISVAEGFISEVGFSIDRTATLNLSSTGSRESGYAPLANKTFHLSGGKVIGTDSLGAPVYKFDEDLVTDAGASLLLENIEWDAYQLTLTSSAWDLAGTNPLRPILLFPDVSLDAAFVSTSHADNSLLAMITDASGSAIASASAHLSGPGGYDETLPTGLENDPDFGQAFFTPLTAGDYDLQVIKMGFQSNNSSISVSGQTEYTIQLNAL